MKHELFDSRVNEPKLPLNLRSQTIYGDLVDTLGHIPEIIR